MSGLTRGMAEGWNTFQDPVSKAWVWTAYGPRGGNQGLAKTEQEAVALARRSAQDLKEPTTQEGL